MVEKPEIHNIGKKIPLKDADMFEDGIQKELTEPQLEGKCWYYLLITLQEKLKSSKSTLN